MGRLLLHPQHVVGLPIVAQPPALPQSEEMTWIDPCASLYHAQPEQLYPLPGAIVVVAQLHPPDGVVPVVVVCVVVVFVVVVDVQGMLTGGGF